MSTEPEKMNRFLFDFSAKAEKFKQNIDSTVFQSPFTVEELNSVDIKRNALFFPNLLSEVRTKRERAVGVMRDQNGGYLNEKDKAELTS